MFIFLLSDTKKLDSSLKDSLIIEIAKRDNRIAYISSNKQPSHRKWFHNTAREYQAMNKDISMEYFDLSEDFSDQDLRKVLDFDIVHLSGGNTFEFIASIRKRDFSNIIQEFLKKNGLIIGISAGGIILTPTISIASINGDENSTGVTDMTGLGMVDFEFFPHFENTKTQRDDILDYSKKTQRKIYACSNESGLFIQNGEIVTFGKVEIFDNKSENKSIRSSSIR